MTNAVTIDYRAFMEEWLHYVRTTDWTFLDNERSHRIHFNTRRNKKKFPATRDFYIPNTIYQQLCIVHKSLTKTAPNDYEAAYKALQAELSKPLKTHRTPYEYRQYVNKFKNYSQNQTTSQAFVNVYTLGDGNCAYNAIALGLMDLLRGDKLNDDSLTLLRQKFIERNPQHHARHSNDDFKNFLLKATPDGQQRHLAPILRNLAIDEIIKNREHYQQQYIDALFNVYISPETDDYCLTKHPHIAAFFKTNVLKNPEKPNFSVAATSPYFDASIDSRRRSDINPPAFAVNASALIKLYSNYFATENQQELELQIKESIEKWWGDASDKNSNAAKYFNALRKNTGTKTWGSHLELNALGHLFGLHICTLSEYKKNEGAKTYDDGNLPRTLQIDENTIITDEDIEILISKRLIEKCGTKNQLYVTKGITEEDIDIAIDGIDNTTANALMVWYAEQQEIRNSTVAPLVKDVRNNKRLNKTKQEQLIQQIHQENFIGLAKDFQKCPECLNHLSELEYTDLLKNLSHLKIFQFEIKGFYALYSDTNLQIKISPFTSNPAAAKTLLKTALTHKTETIDLHNNGSHWTYRRPVVKASLAAKDSQEFIKQLQQLIKERDEWLEKGRFSNLRFLFFNTRQTQINITIADRAITAIKNSDLQKLKTFTEGDDLSSGETRHVIELAVHKLNKLTRNSQRNFTT